MPPSTFTSTAAGVGAGGPGKKDKVVSLKGDEAEEVVLEYMRKTNRPYSSTDVSANLHGTVSKPLAQKALVALAGQGKVTKKDYGKQTIFVFPQANLPPTSTETLAALDSHLERTKAPFESGTKRVKVLRSQLAALVKEPRTDELPGLISELRETIAEKRARLNFLQSGAPPIPASAIDAAARAWTAERAQWVARRRVYVRVVDGLTGEVGMEDRRKWEEQEVGCELEVSEAVRELEASDLVLAPPPPARPSSIGRQTASAPRTGPASGGGKRKASAGSAGGGVKKVKLEADGCGGSQV